MTYTNHTDRSNPAFTPRALIAAICIMLCPAVPAQTTAGSSAATATAATATGGSSRGGNTDAARRGQAEHKRFSEDLKKSDPARYDHTRMSNLESRKVEVPDGFTKSRRPIELKSESPTGRYRGPKQLERYETTSGRRGIRMYYDQNGGARRIERTPFREWRAREMPRAAP